MTLQQIRNAKTKVEVVYAISFLAKNFYVMPLGEEACYITAIREKSGELGLPEAWLNELFAGAYKDADAQLEPLVLAAQLKDLTKERDNLLAAVKSCVEKFEKPEAIVPELVEVLKERKNVRKKQ